MDISKAPRFPGVVIQWKVDILNVPITIKQSPQVIDSVEKRGRGVGHNDSMHCVTDDTHVVERLRPLTNKEEFGGLLYLEDISSSAGSPSF